MFFSYVSWALDCKLGLIQVGMGAKYGFYQMDPAEVV